MYSTPYGTGPPGRHGEQGERDLSPAQAYRLARPNQRRRWFGDEPPTTKAAQYDHPPAATAPGRPPDLEAAVREHQLTYYAPPICPRCTTERKDGGAVNGRVRIGPA